MSSARPLELPPRRECVTETWRPVIGGIEHELVITFGFARDGRLREVFCSGHKEGSHMRAAVQDGCIAISHLLQRGATIFELAAAFGEDRGEGAKSGPPASVLGAIARKGCELIAGHSYICSRTDDICGARPLCTWCIFARRPARQCLRVRAEGHRAMKADARALKKQRRLAALLPWRLPDLTHRERMVQRRAARDTRTSRVGELFARGTMVNDGTKFPGWKLRELAAERGLSKR